MRYLWLEEKKPKKKIPKKVKKFHQNGLFDNRAAFPNKLSLCRCTVEPTTYLPIKIKVKPFFLIPIQMR
jgi:hypothetical protein